MENERRNENLPYFEISIYWTHIGWRAHDIIHALKAGSIRWICQNWWREKRKREALLLWEDIHPKSKLIV